MKFFASVTAYLVIFASIPYTLTAQRITRQEYILEYKDIAIRQMELSGIPASIILAQACLESADGNSPLATEGNNHFGIKCHDWKGKTIYQDDDLKNECFRKYSKAEDSFRDHSDFLRYRDIYSFLFNLDRYDYKGWAYGLKKAGYATNPQYAQLLIGIIEDCRLYKYDHQATSIPPPPDIIELSERIHPTKGSPLYRISLYREVYTQNKTAYIIANEYDTYSSLAKEYNLFTKEILRFNDLKHDQRIEPGTIVYVAQKRKQSAKHLDKHVFEEGDTMYDLSQRFGIRLKYLYKYNNIPSNREPQPGDIINLRKKK